MLVRPKVMALHPTKVVGQPVVKGIKSFELHGKPDPQFVLFADLFGDDVQDLV